MNGVNTFIATTTCQLTPGKCKPYEIVQLNVAGIAKFPNKEVMISGFWGAVGFLFSLLMILSLLYPVANVIRSLGTCASIGLLLIPHQIVFFFKFN